MQHFLNRYEAGFMTYAMPSDSVRLPTLKVGGASISAVVTADSLDDMGLKEGDRACTVFKASSVILGAPV